MNTSDEFESDACEFLDADYGAADLRFSEYQTLIGSYTRQAVKKRVALAQDICLILAVHTRLKQEVFYPALMGSLSVAELLAEAQVEIACAHFLMARIEQKEDVDTDFDALVKTLSLHAGIHMHKERAVLFPVVRASRRLDLPRLRRTLEARQQDILLQENDRVAARLQLRADQAAARRELTLEKGRVAAKSRNFRRGAVVVYKLALTDVR